MLMPMSLSWSPQDALLIFLMWAVMMIAMMIPTLVPLLMLVSGPHSSSSQESRRTTRALALIGAYSISWTLFSALATGIHWGLLQSGWLTPMAIANRTELAGVLLLAAGLYQLTPFKDYCLKHCRSPLGLMFTDWKPGIKGAFRLGWIHGWHCMGCCWALMCLLFVFGAMNLLWVAALAALVFAEKVLGRGVWPSRVLGYVLIGWGSWFLV